MPSPFILLLAAHLSIGGFLPPLCMTRTLVRCLKFWTMWGSWWVGMAILLALGLWLDHL